MIGLSLPILKETYSLHSISQTPNKRSARVLEYRLACGRTVYVEECHISLSKIGYLAGSKDAIRADIIKRLPERVRAHFPGNYGLLLKPLPDGESPLYTFMVALVCDQPISDPTADFSSLVICWLGDNIEAPLPEMIEREIRSVVWDIHAVDGWT